MRRFGFVPSKATAREIERLSREFDISEQEVVEQLVELGLDEVSDQREGPESGPPTY